MTHRIESQCLNVGKLVVPISLKKCIPANCDKDSGGDGGYK